MKKLENLSKLVSIRSDANCKEILKFLKSELTGKVEEIKVIDEKIFIAGINTTLKDIEPLVLSGHIDTVGANEQLYTTYPYELTEVDGKGYGLGSIDMKSFTAVVLDNIDKLKNFLCPIVLALTTDEETELNSIEFMIETFKKLGIKPKFTILGEPTNSEFNLCSNACYEYKVKFFGKACHSSKISEGVNAICACAKLIGFLEENQKKYKLTSNCGVVKGGEVVNKVPDYAELIFDIRSIQPEDVSKFIEEIKVFLENLQKEYLGLSVEMNRSLAIPAYNNLDNKKINSIAEELSIKTAPFSGGCEAGYYTSYSGDAVIFGVGDLSLAHKPNEFVVIDEYERYSQKLLPVLKSVENKYFNDK